MNDTSVGQRLSIFLVDDHMIFRQSFEAFLSTQEGVRFVGSGNGQSRTVPDILSLQPRIVLLDFHLERENGLELLQKLREAGFQGKIVFLTMNRDARIRDAARVLGADGFVSKDADGHALLAGLSTLASGQTDYLDMSVDGPADTSNPYQLTRQEMTIARLVCSGLNSEEVAERLFISIHTVHTHRRRILEKTGAGTFIEVCRKLQ
jgi:DNA-binding NarL/FixJ family response regulator